MFCEKTNTIVNALPPAPRRGLAHWLILPLLLLSCEKALMEPDAASDPETVFEEIWTFADRHYSFFEEKNVDWDALYDTYRPRVDPGMSPVALFDLCAEMLYELRDGHVNLLSSFDRSRYWQWYLDEPENFHYPVIERHYMQNRQRLAGPLQIVNLGHLEGVDDLIYVYYGSFAQTISDSNLDLLIGSLSGTAGLIFDVRNNGGGSPENARRLVSRFTAEKVFVGTNYRKTGPGHNDFRAEEVFIEPHNGLVHTGPVIVLTNRKSYSATTYFAQYMKALDNVTLVGDATGGGGGIPAFHDLPNGWLLRVSSSRFTGPGGQSIEPGVEPHVRVSMSEEGILEGRDDILEKAIELLSGNNS